MSGANQYDAFISYSHKGERDLARALEADLSSFGRKWRQLRGLRSYRDETNLSAEPKLWPAIERAVRESGYLVLLASPDSAKSSWVPREVRAALEMHPSGEKVIVAQTAGLLPWTDNLTMEDALSRPDSAINGDLLRELESRGFEPFVVDLRNFRDPEQRRSQRAEYLTCVASMAARILGKRKEEVWGDYYRAQRLRTVFLGTVASALFGLLIALGFALKQSQSRLQLAQSQASGGDARLLASAGEINAGLRESVRAYRRSPSVQARAALLDLLGRTARVKGFFPCGSGRKASGLAISAVSAPQAAFACTLIGKDTNSELVLVNAQGDVVLRKQLPGHIDALSLIDDDSIAANGATALRIISVKDGSVTELASGSEHMLSYLYVPRHEAIVAAESDGTVRLWSRHEGKWTSGPTDVYKGSSAIEKMHFDPSLDAVVVRFFLGSPTILPFADESSPIANAHSEEVDTPVMESSCTASHERVTRAPGQTVAQAADAPTVAYLTEENYVVVDKRITPNDPDSNCILLYGNTHNAQVAISADGRYVATAGAYFNSDTVHGLILWDLQQVHPLAQVIPDTRTTSYGNRLGALSRDGSSWAFVLPDRIRWNDDVLPVTASQLYPLTVALSADGSEMAVGYADGHVEVIERANIHAQPTSLRLGKAAISTIWFVGRTLLARDGDDNYWRISAGATRTATIEWEADPEGYSCSDVRMAGAVLLRELRATGKPPRLLMKLIDEPPRDPLDVSAEGESCSSFAYSGQARVGVRLPGEYVDMSIFTPEGTPHFRPLSNPLHDRSGLRQRLRQPFLTDDGRMLAAISDGHGVALFDIAEGRLIGTIDAPETSALALSADGKRMMTYQDDVGIVSWDLDADHWAAIAERMSGAEITN